MIHDLKIKNLILVDVAHITFGAGLNILTGETGAGKSAILAAIRLLSGERADPDLIRKGTDSASMEARIQFPKNAPWHLLEEIGIAISDKTKPLLIRREIHSSGKSRAFIEEAQVNATLLRQFVTSAIERVDQSAAAALSSKETQRQLLDDYAAIDTTPFAASFASHQKADAKLSQILQLQQESERSLRKAVDDLEAIDEVDLRKGEEEMLTADHHRLTHAQDLIEKIGEVVINLSESTQPILPMLRRFTHTLEQCASLDSNLTECADSLRNASLELDEVTLTLRSYLDRLDQPDPKQLFQIEKRLAAIETLKRRFGKTEEEIDQKREELVQQIDTLGNLDAEIEAARKDVETTQQQMLQLAERLTEQRKAAATLFQEKIAQELKSLNLPHVVFQVHILPKPLTQTGADETTFLFSANPGHPPLPLEKCASGGEQSRLLFAITTALAEKGGISCVIFDEIDSNVGGQTASILGQKLQEISAHGQAICVTHFLQVARCATHHFLVSKSDKGGASVSTIQKLTPKTREQEFARMLGN